MTSRVARPSTAEIQALLFVGLVVHSIRTPRPKAPPKPPGRHRQPEQERHGNGIAWWVWTAVAVGYAWLTWRMAAIELPTMAGLGAVMTFALAYTAGRNHR